MTQTVKIKDKNKPYDYVVIEKRNFDPKIHQLYYQFEEVSESISSSQKKLISDIWDYYVSKGEWIPEQVLFHPQGPLVSNNLSRSEISQLQGLIVQFIDKGKSRYQVTFPGLFFSNYCGEFEGIIHAYLKYLQNKYLQDALVESISSKELVSGNIISDDWAHKLGLLLQQGGFLWEGSLSGPGPKGWEAGFPSKMVIESFDHKDLKKYIRNLIADWYDPNLDMHELVRWANMSNKSDFAEFDSIKETELSRKEEMVPNKKKVFVVHGRDDKLRIDFFSFLRSLSLEPMEWSEAIKLTGKASPYIGEILHSAFSHAQAVVVLLTPDDQVRLSPDLWGTDEIPDETAFRLQARPNVLFEAGMAFGTHPDRTLLVEIGKVKAFSDIDGRHVIRLSNDPEKRKGIADRLDNAGCDVSTSGEDWLSIGDFSTTRTTNNEFSNHLPKNISEEDILAMLDVWWSENNKDDLD